MQVVLNVKGSSRTAESGHNREVVTLYRWQGFILGGGSPGIRPPPPPPPEYLIISGQNGQSQRS